MPSGWTNLSVRDNTKELIEDIAETEGMKQADVVHESIGFVYDNFYEEPEPEGPPIDVPEEQKENPEGHKVFDLEA